MKPVPACDQRAARERKVVENGVETTDARVETNDMDEVRKQVRSENSVCGRDTVDLSEVRKMRLREG